MANSFSIQEIMPAVLSRKGEAPSSLRETTSES
jgi:hypothetical protein